MTGQQDARTYARQIFEHVAAEHGGADADLYLAKVVAALFELSPIVRELVSDLVVVEVSEELYRRGKPGRDAARMVAEIQRDWMQGR